MSPPRLIAGLAEVAPAYEALFCDVWGVVHDGRESFPAACEALARFRRERGPVVLVSNSPRPAEAVRSQLHGLGVPDESWSLFITSGDATRAALRDRAPGPVWAVGPVRDAPLYDGLGLDFAETPEEAAFVCCSGPFDDEIETPEDFRTRFQVCVDRGLEMICANPDKVVQRGDKLIYCAGALADLYAELGGRTTLAGKPYPPIYDSAFAALAKAMGREVDRARVLVIGDGVPTDVKGANAERLDCLFVASGIHAAETLTPQGAVDPARLGAFLQREGVESAYAIDHLRW